MSLWYLREGMPMCHHVLLESKGWHGLLSDFHDLPRLLAIGPAPSQAPPLHATLATAALMSWVRCRQDGQPLGSCTTSFLEMLQSPQHRLPLECPASTPKSLPGADRDAWQHQDSHAPAPQLEVCQAQHSRGGELPQVRHLACLGQEVSTCAEMFLVQLCVKRCQTACIQYSSVLQPDSCRTSMTTL